MVVTLVGSAGWLGFLWEGYPHLQFWYSKIRTIRKEIDVVQSVLCTIDVKREEKNPNKTKTTTTNTGHSSRQFYKFIKVTPFFFVFFVSILVCMCTTQVRHLHPQHDWWEATARMKDDCRCSSLVRGSRCVTNIGHNTTLMSSVAPSLVMGR